MEGDGVDSSQKSYSGIPEAVFVVSLRLRVLCLNFL